MIYTRENKASLCRGDFHPAELYKGDKKIAGYVRTDVEGIDSVTLTDCYNDKVYDAQIIGNSVQDGDPTPEAPVDVQSVGDLVEEGEYAGKYKIPVTVRGKNLWTDKNYIDSSSDWGVYKELSVKSNTWIKSGTTFTLSLTSFVPENSGRTSMRVTIATLLAGGTSINAVRADYNIKGEEIKLSLTYTIPETEKEIKGLRMWLMDYSTIPNGVTDGYVKDIQIELGDTATEFEPYIEPQAIDIYLDEPLRKISNYNDYIDFKKGVVVRNIAEKVFDGSEVWEYDVSTNRNTLLYQEKVSSYVNTGPGEITAMSDRIKRETWSRIWQNYYKSSGATDLITGIAVVYNQNDGAGNSYLYIKASPYSTLPTIEEWKAQLAAWYEEGNPFTVWYVIPEEEEAIDITELKTFKGTTIYEIDTSIAATISGNYKQMDNG